jgi:two-component sensor histidine kinase
MRSIYYQNSRWKVLLLGLALIIGAVSLMYTDRMVQSVRKQERKNMELWANATRALSMSEEFDASLEVLVAIIQSNDNIPVVLTDSRRAILSYNNISETKAARPGYLQALVEEMEVQHPPIRIQAGPGIVNYIYYSDSLLLYRLRYYPLFQLMVICIFLAISYAAFSTSRRYEQEFLWVGMAKETAHQLGTPISSLMALQAQWDSDDEAAPEQKTAERVASPDPEWQQTFDKDLQRLRHITERFSKIGSTPVLQSASLETTLLQSVDYLKPRSPDNITWTVRIEPNLPAVPHHRSLMEWVLENLIKNAVDAMPHGGELHLHLHRLGTCMVLDVRDTGVGIPRSRHRLIFKPGISTRKRGWGLGLTLTKRIVELNHGGSIKVLNSEPGKGTTFRIKLPLKQNPLRTGWQRFRDLWVWGMVLGLGQGLALPSPGYGQAQRPLWQVHTHYALYLPGGDLRNRFGASSLIGLEIHRQAFVSPAKSPSATPTRNRGWIWSMRLGHLFGGQVLETNLFGSVATPSGDLINANGVFEDYRLRQFGWLAEGRAGRLILPLGPKGSGIRLDLGLGVLQHKIWIETPNNNTPQMSSTYKKGYDRLCEGMSLSQALTYQYLAPNKRINFQIGLDLVQAFTRERRTVRYDSGFPVHYPRKDFLKGLRVAWILPVYERSEKSQLYFD